jgi:hypothetical protein
MPAEYQQLESVQGRVLIEHFGDAVAVGENDLSAHAKIARELIPPEPGEVSFGQSAHRDVRSSFVIGWLEVHRRSQDRQSYDVKTRDGRPHAERLG